MALENYSEFNPYTMLCMGKEIEFDDDMEFLCVDMKKSDIPYMSMFAAQDYVQDIYDLLMFNHKMFYNGKIKSHMYLLQKEMPVPGGDKIRYRNQDGYLLLGAFDKETFSLHFSTICRAAMAINCGFMKLDDILNSTVSLDEVKNKLATFNEKAGTFKYKRDQKQTDHIGKFKVIAQLDKSIEKYHNYRLYEEEDEHDGISLLQSKSKFRKHRNCVCSDASKIDQDEVWQERARLLSWRYLLEHSDRQQAIRDSLYSLGNVMLGNLCGLPEKPPNMKILDKIATGLDEGHLLMDVFKKHYNWLKFENSVRVTETKTILNLKERIAWNLTDAFLNFDFYQSRFLIIHTDDDAEKEAASIEMMDIDEVETKEEWLILQQSISKMATKMSLQGNTAEARKEAGTLYPILEKLGEGTCKPIANWLGEKGHVCRLYQNPAYSALFTDNYKMGMSMANGPVMSGSRIQQYRIIPTLTSNAMFSAGNMNALLDREGHRRLLVCCNDPMDVEPIQDAMANHFLLMAELSGVRQMSVDLILILLANIFSFTPMPNHPIIALDGPPGCGKSNVASIAKIIMTWKNDLACQTEEYITSRSRTVPDPSSRYDCVLGSCIINEWICDKACDMEKDLSTEATIFKHIYDQGKCTSQRACKMKMDGMERFTKSFDVCLDNRSMVICANGFRAAPSIMDRVCHFQVPALKVDVQSNTLEESEQQLNDAALPAHFALIRYLISEQANRDYVNMSLKACDSQKLAPSYESDLTMMRVENVLNEMGFKNLLTQRKKDMINRTALILAYYRAAFEVYGCVTKAAPVDPPNSAQKLEDYNDYLVERMTSYLANNSQQKKDMLFAERVVVDPSDILTASTLVLPLNQTEKNLLGVIAVYLMKPECMETRNGEKYFYVENVTMTSLLEEMKLHNRGILIDTLKQKLQRILDDSLRQKVPSIIRMAASGDVNRNRDRNDQIFTLFVHAQLAAELFLKEEKEVVEECLATISKYIEDIITGDEDYIPHPYANNGHEWFSQVICMRIPAHLQSAFVFLSHLQGADNKICPSDCDKIKKSTGEKAFGVHPDFANCRTKAVQSLLVKIFQKAKSENVSVPSFDVCGKFLRVDMLASRNLATDFTGLPDWMPRDEEMAKLVQRNGDGCIKIHVDIFSGGHDQVEGIVALRNHIAENHILTGTLAKDNYFTIENGKVCEEVIQNRTLITASISNMDSDSYLVENRQLYVSTRLLNRVTTIFAKEKQSAARAFVEKCICQDMTEFKSIMYFDRERVYETQRESDAIGFVSVADVTQRVHGRNLPKWETHWQSSTMRNKKTNIDVYTEVLSNLTVKHTANNKNTYSPGHGQTKLELKHLYATNTINELIETTSATTQDRNQRKDLFTKKLERNLNGMRKYVKELYCPLICNDKELACEVYHKEEDYVCNFPDRKRKHEDTSQNVSSSQKRVCFRDDED